MVRREYSVYRTPGPGQASGSSPGRPKGSGSPLLQDVEQQYDDGSLPHGKVGVDGLRPVLVVQEGQSRSISASPEKEKSGRYGRR